VNEYQDQSVWFEVYGLGSGTEWFVEDFDTRWEAEAFAEGYFGQYEEYRIKRCTGLDER
jgi:hypothetical protein